MSVDLHHISPLRDRKKLKQKVELLRVAAELFKRLGYEKTRIQDIAIQADVSTTTVYNYFPNKQEILIGLLMQDRLDSQAAFERAVKSPRDDPIEAFAELLYENVAVIRSAEDKQLWREVLAAVIRTHDRENDQFHQNREVFKKYIKRLLSYFITKRTLSSAIPITLATEMIFALNTYNIENMVAAKSWTPERIRDLSRQQLALLFADWHAK